MTEVAFVQKTLAITQELRKLAVRVHLAERMSLARPKAGLPEAARREALGTAGRIIEDTVKAIGFAKKTAWNNKSSYKVQREYRVISALGGSAKNSSPFIPLKYDSKQMKAVIRLMAFERRKIKNTYGITRVALFLQYHSLVAGEGVNEQQNNSLGIAAFHGNWLIDARLLDRDAIERLPSGLQVQLQGLATDALDQATNQFHKTKNT
jgi:hypothetical protein